MLDAAQKGDYGHPAIDVTSLLTLNRPMHAFAESKSDGIVQVSTGGGEFASGTAVNIFAAACGNVRGSCKPGAVKLKPTIPRDGQAAEFGLVFPGGSGTPLEEIRETLACGVVKMNIDTDSQ